MFLSAQQYNDKDMTKSTLEDAILELGKHTEVSDLQVQYNPPGMYVFKTFFCTLSIHLIVILIDKGNCRTSILTSLYVFSF